MSLKRNIVANYISQFYVSIIGIALLPSYVRYMGAEAYGLVGFYALLQVWFLMLDMGLSPTMSRQTARYLGGAIDADALWRLLRAMELIFVAVAIVGSACLIFAADFIATRWLNVHELAIAQVHTAVVLMALIAALRWLCGLYRSAIVGLEKQAWLSGLNSFIATLRYAAVIPFLIYVGSSPQEFFTYQLGVAILELALLVYKLYSLLPSHRTPIAWTIEPVRGVLGFSLSVAFAGVVGVLVTQTDKFLLSRLLALADYGYFTLAVLLASGVTMMGGPLSIALVPRMTRMLAEGDVSGMVEIYRRATQFAVVISVPCALVLGVFARQVLWAWTGNAALAERVAPVLTLYAFGNGLMILAAFQHYLQFANGNLRLHVVGNFVFLIVLVPLLFVATLRFGMLGAGWVWLLANASLLLLWVPVVHRRFAPGLHWSWLGVDVGRPFALACAVAIVLRFSIDWPHARGASAILLVIIAALLTVAAAIGSKAALQQIARVLGR